MLTTQHTWHSILNDAAHRGKPSASRPISDRGSHVSVPLKAARTREGGSRAVREAEAISQVATRGGGPRPLRRETRRCAGYVEFAESWGRDQRAHLGGGAITDPAITANQSEKPMSEHEVSAPLEASASRDVSVVDRLQETAAKLNEFAALLATTDDVINIGDDRLLQNACDQLDMLVSGVMERRQLAA